MTTRLIFETIERERAYQDAKWGTLEQHPHEIAAWVLYIEHHLVKARERASTESGGRGALDELRKVAALCFACMEQHGVVERS